MTISSQLCSRQHQPNTLLTRRYQRSSGTPGTVGLVRHPNPRVQQQRSSHVALAALVEEAEEADDFYSVLGVSPVASPTEIKRAYYSVMREVHPDVSNDDEDTTEFAVFLNDVYETLSDPERRAAYDEIAGIAATGINPFADASYEADKVFVDEYTCIGCRNCSCVAAKTFAIEEEFGRARVMAQGVDPDERLQEAIDTCPVNCIHWVTAPQLTLLENEMRKMERVSAWLLMNGGGSAVNVFLEASNTWEKRRAAARSRVQTANNNGTSSSQPDGSSWFSKMWQPAASAQSYGAGTTEEEEEEDGNPRPSDDVRRRTAASVANAARKWRDLRRRQRQRGDGKIGGLLVASTSVDSD